MMHANVQTITPSEHERAEWRRMAIAAYRVGRRGTGHRYNMAAALRGAIPLTEFDALQRDYLAWLLDNVYPKEV